MERSRKRRTQSQDRGVGEQVKTESNPFKGFLKIPRDSFHFPSRIGYNRLMIEPTMEYNKVKNPYENISTFKR